MQTIKILCTCGTKFAFDADETVTFAEGSIACPNCGADASAAANASLPGSSVPVPSAPAAGAPRLSINKPVAEPEPDLETAGQSEAETQEEAPPASPPRRRAVAHRPKLSKAEQQIRANEEAARRRKPFVLLAMLLVLAAIGFWGWYKFSGSIPKVALSMEFERAKRPVLSRLLSGDEMVLLNNRRVSLVGLPGGDTQWSVDLGSVTNFDDGQPMYVESDTQVGRPMPELRLAGESCWLIWPDQITELDLKNGSTRQTIELGDRWPDLYLGDAGLLIETEAATTNALTFQFIPYAGGSKRKVTVPELPREGEPTIIPYGESVISMQTRLLEKIYVTNVLSSGPKVMTAAGVEKRVDQKMDQVLNENLTAGNSLGAATEIVQSWRQADDALPDEIVEDRSRYEVEVLRQGPDGRSTFKGECIGTPRLYPLPSVWVLLGEKQFTVIDHQGNKKWSGNLSYPLGWEARYATEVWRPDFFRQGSRSNHESLANIQAGFPFVERDGVLYSVDRGVIAAWDLGTGEVKWRVTSVGTRKLMFDADGMLYAATTMTSPDALSQSEFKRGNDPIDALLKVDPSSGKILWKSEYTGSDLFISGKFVYSHWLGENQYDKASMMAAGGRGEFMSSTVARINPDDGKILWRLDYKGTPDVLQMRDTTLLIQYQRQLDVATFFSL